MFVDGWLFLHERARRPAAAASKARHVVAHQMPGVAAAAIKSSGEQLVDEEMVGEVMVKIGR